MPTPPSARKEPRMCADCGRILGTSAVICMGCGYNTQTGTNVGTGKPPAAGKLCFSCGYDLTGAPTARCPECGTANTRAARRKHTDARERAGLNRKTLLKPLLSLAISLLISLTIIWLTRNTAYAVAYMIQFPLTIPIMMGGYLTISLFFLGFDEPLWYVTLRISAIAAVAFALNLIVDLQPLIPLGWLVGVIAFVALTTEELETDIQDACLITVGTYAPFLAFVWGTYALAIYKGWI